VNVDLRFALYIVTLGMGFARHSVNIPHNQVIHI